MTLLLDTHALLWSFLDDPKLSPTARRSVASTENKVLVSPASLWEIAIKISVGKYQLPRPFEDFMREQLAVNQFDLLPISVSHMARVITLPFHHRDPFDRLIIAQALVEEVPVVSVDSLFDGYGVERVW
uniref:PIN domain nuclease, a component of toxin-antitoxin system (PIN domain) n=1 Tax=Candidatus Kentrum sp. FM TaxID=2126340 RepID=A0A450TAZ7_9GAMM|nr:MAG: PIN domain nuclease, a component of toxin-antitoxin system (PIN domain) [Candidatus Kentron sp. FM]VFJ63891.1 MAG: PIN domain nuclease, a component of toxin-antitoxin system (PIN domain) [Candidatus Kentron sp. FM]VFK09757.1 MAG: PIN domain nuclease, a component of toxin-antitoxin system (PIN domain) [Candidatus Kentron sp. FM]